MPHPGPDGRWIRCDAAGHCVWTGRTSVAAARRRLYEASRGPLAPPARVDAACRVVRCVNLDHLRVVRASTAAARPGHCLRGHAAIAANVVRHRDGRIAYCKLCRSERRRERYRLDTAYALREIERQRRLRTTQRRRRSAR